MGLYLISFLPTFMFLNQFLYDKIKSHDFNNLDCFPIRMTFKDDLPGYTNLESSSKSPRVARALMPFEDIVRGSDFSFTDNLS